MKKIVIEENGLNMVFAVTEQGELKLLHFSALPFDEGKITSYLGTKPFQPVEVQVTGVDKIGERHGDNYVYTGPGYRLLYKELIDERNSFGRKIEAIMVDDVSYDDCTGLEVHSHYQFYDGIPVVRCWTEVINQGKETLGLEYVSSFTLTGIEKEGIKNSDEKLKLWIPHNAWQKELHWNRYDMGDLGMSISQPGEKRGSSKTIGIGNTGNWSTKEYLPMGLLHNEETDSSLYWQIEHNGSWYWELGDEDGHMFLKLSGPTEHQSHWWKQLKPGESFSSVYVSVGSCTGGFDKAMGGLTQYRRAIRRKNADNELLGVIFNDYMNCLFGDPTTEKERPLIASAKEAGCEYYCVDCGWYADGFWWDEVGEWLPSDKRFPNGLKEVMDDIRDKGMIPGVWLELEVMGKKCPKADRVPKEWYFVRHGKKILDRSRYQLDFRNPEVREHATEVIDRLVTEYGVGYIKMDYNIEPGSGTEIASDSFGDGLLEHNRAYLAWLDGIFAKYPELIIENCSSGGLRMDYAMLSRYSIQSTSDQEDYVRYATIAANSPSGLTPEQSAIWSYPLKEGDDEEAVFNMVNAMLLRIHQSGHLAELSKGRLELVKEGICCYKRIRNDIKRAVPFWPLGLSAYTDSWVCLGLHTEERDYIAVWRRNSKEAQLTIPIPERKGTNSKVCCLYPEQLPVRYEWNAEAGKLSVELPNPVSARIFEIKTVKDDQAGTK